MLVATMGGGGGVYMIFRLLMMKTVSNDHWDRGISAEANYADFLELSKIVSSRNFMLRRDFTSWR